MAEYVVIEFDDEGEPYMAHGPCSRAEAYEEREELIDSYPGFKNPVVIELS